MLVIRCFPLLQLLVYFICIRGEDSKGENHEELKSMIATLTGVVRAQGERMEEQEENISNLRKSLDKRLKENDLKIEWALTDGTLAPKNTSSIIEIINETLSLLKDVHRGHRNTYEFPASCAEIYGGQVVGVHHIYPRHNYTVPARCDSSNGGGWTVIQKRFDGSVDFYRGWEEYAEGFGDPAGEYWLGLRNIHALTAGQTTELYVGVTDFDQGRLYAKYSTFSVSSEKDNFRLHVGGFSGTAGNGLKHHHNNQTFSTMDHGNHCPVGYHGAWWYGSPYCHRSNLNGVFSNIAVNGWKYMVWTDERYANKAMKASVMTIRPSNFRT